ncbi:MAG: methylmalonyl-CoA epimerase [Bacteroidetes bacterium]|nr:methylmalonyl-CoA epimerase [Bacteroidota bacterium]
MFRKIEHLGIAVENIEESLKIYENLLGAECYKIEIVESEFVKTAFIQIGESKIELLEPTDGESQISKFLKKKGQGFHHVAFDVENIDDEIKRLIAKGFVLINQTSKDGADNKRIAFLHPKSTNGLLVELCQEK